MKFGNVGLILAWELCTLAAVTLASVVAAYLLWRTQMASRPVSVGTDIVPWGLGAAVCGIVLSLPLLATLRWRSAIRYLLVSTAALGGITYLYVSQLACSMKVAGLCEPLF